ncbi:SDR family oxidoreductase [Leuconostocaceae bacterium ESL0723]|nr:SDR family oxidoreductase [Leuconostocaceae bacterium ESL0723]
MSKVMVIGAHGHVGRILVPKLADAGHDVVASFRDVEQFSTVEHLDHVECRKFNALDDEETMVSSFKNSEADAIVFTAGAGGASDKLTVGIDLDGAVKTMDAAKKAGIKRYVMVSAAGADDPTTWENSGLYVYYVMKHYADRILRGTDLDYTIVRPTLLSNDAETSHVSTDFNLGEGGYSIPRADVANFVTAVIDQPKTFGKIYPITSGGEAIKDVL